MRIICNKSYCQSTRLTSGPYDQLIFFLIYDICIASVCTFIFKIYTGQLLHIFYLKYTWVSHIHSIIIHFSQSLDLSFYRLQLRKQLLLYMGPFFFKHMLLESKFHEITTLNKFCCTQYLKQAIQRGAYSCQMLSKIIPSG